MLFQGKTAIVTGGASGIGRAIVQAFLSQGVKTVVILDKQHIEPTAFTYNRADQEPVSVVIDLSEPKQVAGYFHLSARGDVDILVNNAGIDVPYSAENPDEEVWHRIMETNLEGARRITEAVYLQMIRQGRKGSIVFITSVHADFAFTNALAYDTSKSALRSYARGLALNLAPHGIRVNEVAPGFVYPTGMTGHATPEEAAEGGKKVPIGRPLKPEEIANACVFLASDMASGITGAILRVDGGFSLVGAFH